MNFQFTSFGLTMNSIDIVRVAAACIIGPVLVVVDVIIFHLTDPDSRNREVVVLQPLLTKFKSISIK